MQPATTYVVTITAVNDVGESSTSAGDSVLTAPDAPVELKHTSVTNTGWTESWAPVVGADSYDVYVNGAKVSPVPVTDTTFTIANQSPGTTYSITVVANNSGGTSAVSAADSVMTVTDAPTGLTHQSVDATGWLEQWNGITGATSYNVYANGIKVNTSAITSTSFHVTGQNADTTYVVTVKAVNGDGLESAASTADSVTTALAKPTGLSHTGVTTTGWTETWSALPDAASYNVYVNGSKVNTTPVMGNSFAVTNKSPGTTYTVTVTAVNSVGESAQSSADTATTSQPQGGGGGGGTPTGGFGTVVSTNPVDTHGGTIVASFNDSHVTVNIPAGAFDHNLMVYLTTSDTTSLARFLPKGSSALMALGVNFDGPAPTVPITIDITNPAIPANAQIFKIGPNGALVPVKATVTAGRATITFTADPNFIVVKPIAVTGNHKAIQFNDKSWIVTGIVHNNTTYLPVWYVMQALQQAGVTTTWDGQN